MRRVGPLIPIGGLALALGAAAAPGQSSAVAPMPTWLRAYIRASDGELKRLDRGEAVTRSLESPDGREVTTVGAIRVRCTADTFVARVGDIERFKAGEYVLQIGRFSQAPSRADVAALTLDDEDRAALRGCRAGSCALRLPAATIERFRTAVPWGSADAPHEADAVMREFLVDEARTYLAQGSSALADYRDRPSTTMTRAAAFHGLLRQSAFQAEFQPQLADYLDNFPRVSNERIESFLYWSSERFGLKPVVNVTHSAILRREDGVVAFASKQVYTSHYFDASLGMSLFIPVPDTPYGYVTYLNRTRVEGLHGPLAGVIRSIASRRGRDGLARNLLDVKRKLEQE